MPDDTVSTLCPFAGETVGEKLLNPWSPDLNICSKKGLSERFDSTIGAGSSADAVWRQNAADPRAGHGGQAACWMHGETDTCSGMAYGFHPQLMAQSPYEGAYQSVVESLCTAGRGRV